MSKIELLKLEEIQYDEKYFKDIERIRSYFHIRDKLKQFMYKVNLKTFQNLFGDMEGRRLWGHFMKDCNLTLEKFETYLTREQMNIFFVNGLLNQHEILYK